MLKRIVEEIGIKKTREGKYQVIVRYVKADTKDDNETYTAKERYTFQSGGDYETVEEAMKEVQDWYDNMDKFMNHFEERL